METIAHTAVYERQAGQRVSELVATLQALSDVDCRRIVEIGTHMSGTAWAFHQVQPEAELICIDPDPRNRYEFATYVVDRSDNSVDQIPGVIDFLYIDGDHQNNMPRADWDLYEPLVRPGGIIAVHDIKVGAFHEVWALWEYIKTLGWVTKEVEGEPTDPYIGSAYGGVGIVWKPC